jgi:SpoVK/Ycf46/Vps4 family AAA+-type ATPase
MKYHEIDITKIEFILKNKNLISKMKGLKLLFYGPTGTGKSTIAKYLISQNPNIKFLDKEITYLLSSKMGQTQINLMNLANELNRNEGLVFYFIDEVDSIVGKRETSDLGENSRITSTFIRFIDSLNDNVILMAATNLIDKIDDAILRRFNARIETKEIPFSEALVLVKDELSISMQKINKIVELFDPNYCVSFAEIEKFINELTIERIMHSNKTTVEIICRYFKEGLTKAEKEGLSRRMKSAISKVEF